VAEGLRYRVGTLGADVTIDGSHRCVHIDERGVWPLKNEVKPSITVRIGYRKGAHEALREFPGSPK
jgi:hypothetical protein